MLSRLLNVRLRAAERAARNGQIDEAYRLARAPDLRDQRGVRSILEQLTDQFIERARMHFREERFAEAMADLAKAEAGGVKADEINELRGHVNTVFQEVQRQAQSRQRRVAEARNQIARGALSAGADILAGASGNDEDARQLAGELAARRQRAVDAYSEVKGLIKNKQWSAALEQFRKAKRLDPQAKEAAAFEETLTAAMVTNARKSFEAGRLKMAGDELGLLGDVGRTLAARRDLEEMLKLVHRAATAFLEHDHERARRHVMRLQEISPKIGWVNKMNDQLGKLDGLLTELHAGPLGEHARSGSPRAAVRSPAAKPVASSLAETIAVPGRRRESQLPAQLLLMVDGAGSFLLLSRDRVSIGRAMSADPPDIAIQSDLTERHAEIARVDDDYFLFSGRDIDVDGAPTRHRLLRDGNRISLSRNARLTFRVPHRASPSGIMDLGSSTKMPHGVRRVILFRRTAMIGFGKTAHVHCNGVQRDLVLFEREGGLWIRPQRNGRGDAEEVRVAIGQPMDVYGVGVVVQPWSAAPSGPSI